MTNQDMIFDRDKFENDKHYNIKRAIRKSFETAIFPTIFSLPGIIIYYIVPGFVPELIQFMILALIFCFVILFGIVFIIEVVRYLKAWFEIHGDPSKIKNEKIKGIFIP
jgi:uncharacterized protein YqhQ